ncbi:unnamed protein product [Phytophthora lilii]|uniref:Unnamed protein product n=1 Tax=Phytophthora lilii TaxID=2077276 RepID=A0A9W6U636_9STRA|nr:unnamed protein product [Phytophthora lilii]
MVMWQTSERLSLDANTADVPTNLQPEDDIGVYGAKDAKMYVVVPDGVVNSLTEQMKMAVNEVLEERDRKRSEYSISTCPRSKETFLKQQLGLEYSAVSVNEVVDDSVHGYQWSALTEKHPDQRTAEGNSRYDDYRRTGEPNGRRFRWSSVRDRSKAGPSYNERWQLLLELVVADLKSEGRCAPVGLLTNLNDYWYFLWFTPDNKIARMVLTCPANGFNTMKEVLKERSGPTRDGHFLMRVAFLGSPLPLKRQKLLRSATGRDDAAAEMLERYELMSDELSPEFFFAAKD